MYCLRVRRVLLHSSAVCSPQQLRRDNWRRGAPRCRFVARRCNGGPKGRAWTRDETRQGLTTRSTGRASPCGLGLPSLRSAPVSAGVRRHPILVLSWITTNRDSTAIGGTADTARPKKMRSSEALSELTHNKLMRSVQTTLRGGWPFLSRSSPVHPFPELAPFAEARPVPYCRVAPNVRWSGRTAGDASSLWHRGARGTPINFFGWASRKEEQWIR